MIIAVKDGNKALLAFVNAYDTINLSARDFYNEENIPVRIWKDKGMVCGFSEFTRISDKFLYDDEFLAEEVTPLAFMRDIIPDLKEKSKQENAVSSKGKWDNELVVCVGEKIFSVDEDFVLREADDFAMYGISRDLFKSCLLETKGLPARERVVKSVQFAAKILRNEFYPIAIVDTESLQLEFIEKGDMQ